MFVNYVNNGPLHLIFKQQQMKTITTLTMLIILSIGISYGQGTNAKASSAASDTVAIITLDSISMQLRIPASVTKGSNGAGVAYNPVKKLYYAAFAGNTSFPMVVFNAKGEVVTDTCTTMIDVRGIWYNPKTATLEANGYAQHGMVQYKLNKAGVPSSFTYLFSNSPQPDDNSVAAYDPVHDELLYFESDYPELYIDRYSKSTGKSLDALYMNIGETDVDYLNTTVVYTGIKGAEIAVVDFDLNVIHLFNLDGNETRYVNLPDDTVVEEQFNFAYANGMFWLFDTASRVWNGYKVK